MFELFLSAPVKDDQLQQALAVFGALCVQTPWESIHHVLKYQGPAQPAGISNLNSLNKAELAQNKDVAMLWKDLHLNLSRQSYMVNLHYEVSKEDFGTGKVTDFNATPAILGWTDWPEPTAAGVREVITQRKKVEIWDQKNLPSVMADNNHRLNNDIIQHTYQCFRDEVEFCLFRQSMLHPRSEYRALQPGEVRQVANPLPAWDSLEIFDPAKRWTLQVKVHVRQENNPDEIQKAQDILLGVQKELEGAIDFTPIDRRCYDTRIQLQTRNAPVPLPQVLTVNHG